jgi:hypothetical protein
MRLANSFAILIVLAGPALANGITTAANTSLDPNFDILRATVSASGGKLTFTLDVTGTAGGTLPAATGAMLGSAVHAYVWPTSLDSAAAGFSAGEGILALAVTAHPDFDDTPDYDEDGDGKAGNDGKTWHSHWVVLAKDDACGAGLKVKDVAPGSDVKLPDTAPGVPLFLDSPDAKPAISEHTLQLTVPMPAGAGAMKFDGVAAGLRVNSEMKAPLLCVSDVFKVASGDLSLPGTVDAK